MSISLSSTNSARVSLVHFFGGGAKKKDSMILCSMASCGLCVLYVWLKSDP